MCVHVSVCACVRVCACMRVCVCVCVCVCGVGTNFSVFYCILLAMFKGPAPPSLQYRKAGRAW